MYMPEGELAVSGALRLLDRQRMILQLNHTEMSCLKLHSLTSKFPARSPGCGCKCQPFKQDLALRVLITERLILQAASNLCLSL